MNAFLDSIFGDAKGAFRRQALIVLLASLATRLLLLPRMLRWNLIGDELWYWAWATGERPAGFYYLQHPRFWALVLRLAAAISHAAWSGRILTCLIASTSPVAVYALASRLWDRRTAFLAGLLLAFSPEHMGYSLWLWKEGFAGVLYTAAASFFFRGRGVTENKRDVIWAFLLTGIALLADEKAVVVLLAFVVALFQYGGRRRWTFLLVGLAALALPMAVCSTITSIQARRFVLVSDSVSAHMQISSDDKEFPKAEGRVATLRREWKMFRAQSGLIATPNSVVVAGLFNPHCMLFAPFEHGAPIGWICVAYAACLFLLAFVAMVVDGPSAFRLFSVTIWTLLAFSSAVMIFKTRFRVPFLFILAAYGARLLRLPPEGGALLTERRMALAVGLTSAAYAAYVVSSAGLIGNWN